MHRLSNTNNKGKLLGLNKGNINPRGNLEVKRPEYGQPYRQQK